MVNVIIDSDPKFIINKLALQAAIIEILQQNSISGHIEISVSIVGDRKMHEINKKYRGIDATTNILSFSLEDTQTSSQLQHIPRVGFVKAPDKKLRLGDILISYQEAVKDAGLEGVSVDDEMVFLVQHGTRHLLGIHHD